METYFLKFSHMWFSSTYALENTYQISQTRIYAFINSPDRASSDSCPEQKLISFIHALFSFVSHIN